MMTRVIDICWLLLLVLTPQLPSYSFLLSLFGDPCDSVEANSVYHSGGTFWSRLSHSAQSPFSHHHCSKGGWHHHHLHHHQQHFHSVYQGPGTVLSIVLVHWIFTTTTWSRCYNNPYLCYSEAQSWKIVSWVGIWTQAIWFWNLCS